MTNEAEDLAASRQPRAPLPPGQSMHPSLFGYLKPSTEQLQRMEAVRQAYADLYAILNATPAGRYRSLAITALEESAMWANKGITRDSDGTPREGATF